ncbi:phosphotransferase family protein [Alphaproteobacteria bacterium]|nr:phosphotransferase family protein [Alphaproteobacteria bacterium]
MIEKQNIKNLGLWLKQNTLLQIEIISLVKFETGQSNPTFIIKSDKKNYVLRSKPKGTLLKGAHRIDREYKVMDSLKNSQIPVPKMYCYCKDVEVIGSEFYIMEFLEGNHEVDPFLKHYNNLEKEKIYDHKIDILTELASLDIKELGLEEFGRPLGYLERQTNLWISQYRASQTKEIESMEFLIENIPKFIPKEIDILPPSLLHGDFRLDNMILKKNKTLNEVAGLLDWELSTLAPPFIDLSYWAVMLRFKKEWPIGGLGNNGNLIQNSGIPSEEMILEKYLNKTGLEKPKYWKYLLAFNSFRFAGILQGITKRLIDGNNAADNAYQVGEQAEPVAKLGAELLKEYL